MIFDLIEKANQVLAQSHPSDEDLAQVESSLSTFLEALATHRISEDVSMDDLEEANRLLQAIRRERSRCGGTFPRVMRFWRG